MAGRDGALEEFYLVVREADQRKTTREGVGGAILKFNKETVDVLRNHLLHRRQRAREGATKDIFRGIIQTNNILKGDPLSGHLGWCELRITWKGGGLDVGPGGLRVKHRQTKRCPSGVDCKQAPLTVHNVVETFQKGYSKNDFGLMGATRNS